MALACVELTHKASRHKNFMTLTAEPLIISCGRKAMVTASPTLGPVW